MSGALPCIILGTNKTTDIDDKLVVQLPHLKESKDPGGIPTHSREGQVIRSQ